MKRRAPSVFLAVLLIFCTGGCRQASEAPLREGLVAGRPISKRALASRLEHHRVPGASIAVIRAGQLDWAKGYGVRQAGEDDAVDTSTLFQAASISKSVTAAGALRLVADGVLTLEDNVNRQLRSWALPENGFTLRQPVTLRHLLSHSAGMTVHGFAGYAEGAELPTLIQVLDGKRPANSAAIRVDMEPGTEFRYSGGGYTVVQQLMVDAAAQGFPDLMDELVLRPVGMTSSTYEQPLPEERRSRAASAHWKNGKPVVGSWHTYPEMAAAGLWTTPTDLAEFAVELWRSYHGLSESLLPQDLTRMMLTRESEEYGLGLSLPRAGEPRFQHGGGNEGYRCFFVLSIESGDGAAIMTNGDLGQALVDEIFAAIAAAYGWRV